MKEIFYLLKIFNHEDFFLLLIGPTSVQDHLPSFYNVKEPKTPTLSRTNYPYHIDRAYALCQVFYFNFIINKYNIHLIYKFV